MKMRGSFQNFLWIFNLIIIYRSTFVNIFNQMMNLYEKIIYTSLLITSRISQIVN